jgi:sporulation protein YlmC with PRC-barrel domain
MTLKTTLALASSLLIGSSTLALAQTTQPAPKPAPPAATMPPPAASPSGQPMWYSHQADEMRASKLIGTKVVNTANETIGDINEIVLGKDGKVAAVVIGVGGFLGMGEREVAVNFDSLQVRHDQNDRLALTLNANKDALKNAPEWRWQTGTAVKK